MIPTLNEEAALPRTLAALAAWPEHAREIVVVDGGSADATLTIARASGAVPVLAGPGRGTQLAAGAARASGDFLLFLHADTVPGTGWEKAVADFAGDPRNQRRAASFRLRFDADDWRARVLAAAANARSHYLGLPYGDQGLVLSRPFYDALGGYRALSLMEDVDLARRIGKRRMVLLDAEAVTSPRRYGGRYGLVAARNAALLTLYFLGVKPERLAALYSR